MILIGFVSNSSGLKQAILAWQLGESNDKEIISVAKDMEHREHMIAKEGANEMLIMRHCREGTLTALTVQFCQTEGHDDFPDMFLTGEPFDEVTACRIACVKDRKKESKKNEVGLPLFVCGVAEFFDRLNMCNNINSTTKYDILEDLSFVCRFHQSSRGSTKLPWLLFAGAIQHQS